MKYFLIFLFGLILSIGQAQEYKDIVFDTTRYVDTISRIEVLTKFENNKMYLRWAPNNASAWYSSVHFGYKIERFEIDDQSLLPKLASRDTMIVKAWPKESYRPFNNQLESSKYIMTMGECVHGEVTSQKNGGFIGPSSEIENKFGFALFAADLDFEAAISGGLGYIDEDAKKDKTYFYRISALNLDINLEPGFETVIAQQIAIPRPYIYSAIEGESKVTIQWSRDSHEPHFSAYWIETSIDGISFDKVSTAPFVGGVSKEYPSNVFSFTDFVENYQPKYYRIKGITPFGNVSQPSDKIRLRGRDRTPCPKPTDISIMTDGATKTVLLKWKGSPCVDLKGYQVMRGSSPTDPLKPVGGLIYKGLDEEFKEVVSTTRNKIYYQVVAIDTAGNRSMTLPRLAPFRDTIPPAIPTGISGEIDSNGVVVLKWIGNNEEDFRGYHVYRANADYHMYTMINPIPIEIPEFKDTITLKTFTEEIFYKVTSVDYQGHISKFSEPIRIVKPDTLRPFPPSIVDYGQEDDYIYFNWTPSRSKDVVSHTLYKKTNKGSWSEVLFDVNKGRYEDPVTQPGNHYTYKIIATDDAGLNSVENATVRIEFVDKSLPEIVVIKECKYLDSTKVALIWEPVKDPKTKQIVVFRSINGGPMTVVSRETPDGTKFEDNKIKDNRTYAYAIKQQWMDGKKSKFSDTVEPINLKE